jgi:hypothetical protein
VIDVGGVRTIVVFVPDVKAATIVARQLMDDDRVAFIELDGGLGATGYARVLEATNDTIPVGAVMFGAESLANAAEFATRYDA